MNSLWLINEHLQKADCKFSNVKLRHKEIFKTNLYIMEQTHERLERHIHLFRKNLTHYEKSVPETVTTFGKDSDLGTEGSGGRGPKGVDFGLSTVTDGIGTQIETIENMLEEMRDQREKALASSDELPTVTQIQPQLIIEVSEERKQSSVQENEGEKKEPVVKFTQEAKKWFQVKYESLGLKFAVKPSKKPQQSSDSNDEEEEVP